MAEIQLYDFFKDNRVRIVIDNNSNEDFYDKKDLDVFTDGRVVTINFKGELLAEGEPICYVQPFKELSAVDLSKKIDGLFKVFDITEDPEPIDNSEVLVLILEEMKQINCSLSDLIELNKSLEFHLESITDID